MNENNTKNLYITPGSYLFKIFIEKFESVLNKHALLKELSRTELKFRSEPWLTKGIRNSTKTKNTLYKISKKRNSPERFQRYKMYRNSFNSFEGKVQKNCITTIYLKQIELTQKKFGKELMIY